MSKKTKLVLLVILLLGAYLRFWQLGNVPPSPDWDEAALGYNAYSIMQTGRDEYGELFPIILRSFDDYKPALYAYLVIPFIKIFGLEVFAVRLPSAIFGIFTVIAAYFLICELMRMSKRIDANKIALLTSFLLAISPWHIQFSRVAFEANVGFALNIFAIFFFIKGFKKPLLIVFSILFFGLSLHVYQAEKVFVPLILFVLVILFRKELILVPKKYLALSFLTGILLVAPLLMYIVAHEQALLRAKGVSIFADQTPFLARTAKRLDYDVKHEDLLGRLVDNRRVTYAVAAVSGYISHFNINWLFITGDEPRHHAPDIGMLYLLELPLVVLGIYWLVFGRFNTKTKIFIILWFLIAPIPASITSGVPHPIRTLNFLPTFQIFTAIGIIVVFSFAKDLYIRLKTYDLRRYLLLLGLTSYVLLTVVNLVYYLNQYFVQQNYFHSQAWQYGYKEAVNEVKKLEQKYEKIIVSNKPHLDQSYMFSLFYLKYPPGLYQRESGSVSGGFREEHRFGKYEFRPIEWEKEEKNIKKILYVGRPTDFPEHVEAIKIINFLNGKPAIKIVEG